METPHLDSEILKLEELKNCNTFWSVAMEEKLIEFKEIKQALSISDAMHRFWNVLAVEITDERAYISTDKLGAIVITENGIYPLGKQTQSTHDKS